MVAIVELRHATHTAIVTLNTRLGSRRTITAELRQASAVFSFGSVWSSRLRDMGLHEVVDFLAGREIQVLLTIDRKLICLAL